VTPAAVPGDEPRPADPGEACTADEAVTALYATEYASLVRLATLLIGDPGTAEEVVQDCFVGLHQRWPRLQHQGTGAAYLRRSVVNRCRSVQRHRRVVDRFLRRAQPETTPSAESAAVDIDRYADVLAAVRTLPGRQREVLVLRYYLDLSEAQTAQVMGISPGAVKSHTARALAALRRVLESPQ
jgi:RNA polymerase sigma-70 factor (sigma-E family)